MTTPGKLNSEGPRPEACGKRLAKNFSTAHFSFALPSPKKVTCT